MLNSTFSRNILLLTFVAFLFSCDNRDKNTIPTVRVDFYLNIYTDAGLLGLRAQGNAEEITAVMAGVSSLGYDDAGILIFNNGDEYYAFDRTCTYDFPKTIPVNLDGLGVAECPECNSRYVLPSLGTPTTEGPAVRPLKSYRTSFNINTGDLHVYN